MATARTSTAKRPSTAAKRTSASTAQRPSTRPQQYDDNTGALTVPGAGLDEIESLKREYARMKAELAEANRAQAAQATDQPEYLDSDLVTVLHGWGRVNPNQKSTQSSPSGAMYNGVGGVYRKVLASDAKYWRQQYGGEFLKILPLDAHEAEFARATGIQPMELKRLAAMNEAVNPADFIEAWGVERVLRWMDRMAATISARRQAGLA